MGIAYSTGVIRDFAGPYYVSEDSMAFGWPTRYWVLDPLQGQGGVSGIARLQIIISIFVITPFLNKLFSEKINTDK